VTRTILVGTAKYGLGLGLLAFVVWRHWAPGPHDTPGLAEILQWPIHLGPLVLAAAICLGSLLLSFVRWWVLVRAQDLPFTVANAFRLGLIGLFWNTFLPGSVGGDAVKAFYLAREQERRTVAVSTVLLDRAVGLWALFWLVALMGGAFWLLGDPALIQPKDPKELLGMEVGPQQIVWLAVGLVVLTSIMWTALVVLPERRGEKFAGRLRRIPKVGVAASEFWRSVWIYRRKQGSVVVAMLLALIGHVGWVLTFYYGVQIFQEPGVPLQVPTLAQHFLIVPIGLTIQALFPAPGGLGGGEFGFGWLYGVIGSLDTKGVVGALVQRLIGWSLALIGYVVYLNVPKPAAAQADKAAERDTWLDREPAWDGPATAQ
jgi:uncharacterized membrane protein YbhN (UPF0104 family)